MCDSLQLTSDSEAQRGFGSEPERQGRAADHAMRARASATCDVLPVTVTNKWIVLYTRI